MSICRDTPQLLSQAALQHILDTVSTSKQFDKYKDNKGRLMWSCAYGGDAVMTYYLYDADGNIVEIGETWMNTSARFSLNSLYGQSEAANREYLFTRPRLDNVRRLAPEPVIAAEPETANPGSIPAASVTPATIFHKVRSASPAERVQLHSATATAQSAPLPPAAIHTIPPARQWVKTRSATYIASLAQAANYPKTGSGLFSLIASACVACGISSHTATNIVCAYHTGLITNSVQLNAKCIKHRPRSGIGPLAVNAGVPLCPGNST